MRTFETPGPLSLHVALQRGEVEIETADTTRTEVDVTALDGDPSDADAVRVEARERPGGLVEVHIDHPKKRSFLGIGAPQLRVRVRCPNGAGAQVHTGSADVRLAGTYGDVALKTASGHGSLDVVEGACKISTASGDIDLLEGHGPIGVNSASGDLTVGIATGPLTASLVSGDVRVREARSTLTGNTVSGDVTVDASAGDVQLSSVSGDVVLGVRSGQQLWIDARSVSGTLRSELETGDAAVSHGEPVVELKVRTVSGDISIVRAAPAMV